MPPCELDAEGVVLAAVMLDQTGAVLCDVRPILREGAAFYSRSNKLIYQAITQLDGEGKQYDTVSVLRCLHDRGLDAQAGGGPYLYQLVEHTPSVTNVREHARVVRDLWRIRRAIARCQEAAARGYTDVGSDEHSVQAFLEQIETDISDLARSGTARMADTPERILDRWLSEGPLVHEPTGLAELDRLTDGGPVYGTRWYLSGEPDAAKTLILAHVADTYVARGIVVGILCADEEPDDVMTRFVQRRGWSRRQCETRDPAVIANMMSVFAAPRVVFYDESYTIEGAAADLARIAKACGAGAMLGVDSVQTARCAKEDARLALTGREMSPAEAVTERVRAIKRVAKAHRIIVIATSEMNRAAYRSRDAREQSSDLASAKWSGAIDYGARVLLALHPVPDQPGLVEVRVPKNKHGPRHVEFFLRVNLRDQYVTDADYAPPVADRTAAAARARSAEALQNAAKVLPVLLEHPALVTRAIAPTIGAATGLSRGQIDLAIARLRGAVVRRKGKKRAEHHYVDGRYLENDVLALLDEADRQRAVQSRPPEEEPAGD